MINLQNSSFLTPMFGAGGGKQKGQATYRRSPDTLRSVDTVEIILGLGEGEWFGLENGPKSYYVGDTILQNPDGSLNFSMFDLEIRNGLPSDTVQPLIPKLGGTSNSTTVNVALSYNTAVTRQMTQNQIDAIDLRFNVNQLYTQDDTGIDPFQLLLKIEIKLSAASVWNPAFSDQVIQISGKTTSTYEKELRIPVARDNDYYQIRVTKMSQNTDATIATDVTWDSIQMINMDLKSYPDTATARIVAQSTDQFSSIPPLSGIFKMRIVNVPTNYDPVNRTYTGTWDGTFKKAWTDNGPWIVYDFVTNPRFGMSAATQLYMDKYEVYQVGVWCDTPVNDGNGGFRPRYTFNAWITNPSSAIEMARYIAGTFNATLFDDNNGTIIMRADMNLEATHLFMAENISAEGFQYSFTDINSRKNDYTVSFKNPDLLYAEDRRRVFNQDHIDEFGSNPEDFIAVGCTNVAEAIARANIKMVTGITEKMLVSFKTNRVGGTVLPFDVMLIADPKNGYGLSGRIKSLDVARTTVTLRDAIYLENGINYSMRLRISGGLSDEYTVTVASTGSVTHFTVSPALPSNLPEFCAFTVYQTAGVGLGAPKPFRVLSVKNLDDTPDQIQIAGCEINRNKFSAAEDGVVIDTTQYSALGDPSAIPGPTNVVFTERYNLLQNQVLTILTVTLPKSVYRYYTGDFEVWSRGLDVDDNPIGSFETRTVFYGDTLIDHPPGKFEFKILPKNTFGQTSHLSLVDSWVHIVSSAEDAGTPPNPVTDPTYTLTATGFILNWVPPAGQTSVVNYYTIKEGAVEGTATVLADNIKDPVLVVDPMLMRTYHLWIYANTIAGVPSTGVAATVTNAAPAVPSNIRVNAGYETVMVFFDRDSGVDIVGYRIRYRQVGTTTWFDMNPNGLLDNVLPDTAYEFQVAAQDALTIILHDEVWSTPYSIRTADTIGVAKGIDDVQASTTQNLVRNGSFERSTQNWTLVSAVVQADAAAPYADPILGTADILKIGDGSVALASAVSDKFVVRANQQYAIGADFKADGSHPGESHIFTMRVYDASQVLLIDYDEDHGKVFIDPNELSTSSFTRLTSVFMIPAGGVYADVFIESRGAGILYVDGVQGQRGAVATAFNPHTVEQLSADDLIVIQNPDNTPPGVVTTLNISTGFKTITLTYSPPADADVGSYDVFRGTTNVLAAAHQIQGSLAPVFVDSDITTGVTYYYWVRAVDRAGNPGAFTGPVSGAATPLSAADFANLSIVNAMIANATIDDAKIANLSVGKLTAGTITAGLISLGNDRFILDSASRQLYVKDDVNTTRVRLGKLGSGATDYGIQIYGSDGTLIIGADGLGVAVVGAGNLANGSVTGDKIVANAIDTTKLAANSVTALQISANSITSAAITAGSVTSDKISVSQLSAISANVGTVSAGTIQSTSGSSTNYWNLTTGAFSIGASDGSTFLRYNPTTGRIDFQGVGTFTNAVPPSWDALTNKPTSLAGINISESNHLNGIETGADVTGTHTANNTSNVGTLTTAQIVAKAIDPAAVINQTSTTIDGGKITTGSIAANKISVATLSALAANIGTVTAGLLRNGANTAFMNLDASGTQDFININNLFRVDASGHMFASSGNISGDMVVTGTITAQQIANNGLTEYGSARNHFDITIAAGDKIAVWISIDQANISDGTYQLRDSATGNVLGTFAVSLTQVFASGALRANLWFCFPNLVIMLPPIGDRTIQIYYNGGSGSTYTLNNTYAIYLNWVKFKR